MNGDPTRPIKFTWKSTNQTSQRLRGLGKWNHTEYGQRIFIYHHSDLQLCNFNEVQESEESIGRRETVCILLHFIRIKYLFRVRQGKNRLKKSKNCCTHKCQLFPIFLCTFNFVFTIPLKSLYCLYLLMFFCTTGLVTTYISLTCN